MKYSGLFVLLLTGSVAFAGPVSKHGQLKVDGVRLVDVDGEPVVLRGASFGWHNFWPRFFNADAVNWLVTDWNCTVLRAAMGVEPRGGYLAKPEWSEQLICDVVDAAIKNDIYVIIDWHSHNIRLEEAKAFFARMAEKYGKYPNIIYEIFNEPERQTWADVKAYSEEVIQTIRAIDPDNLIMVGSPHWSQDVDIAASDPITGYSNLIYSLHFYAATHKQQLRNKANTALKKGLPLFVSECAAMEASGDGPIDHDQWRQWLEWMEQNKISWVVWSVSDKNETCSMLLPKSSSTGGWSDDDIKEWGNISRKTIKEMNSKSTN
jgi:endoglucanase